MSFSIAPQVRECEDCMKFKFWIEQISKTKIQCLSHRQVPLVFFIIV